MFKTLIIIFCMTTVMVFTYADSSVELHVKINNENVEQTPKTLKRVYPKYKTEKSLLVAYARAWAKDDYRLMYHLLSQDTREEWTFNKFKRLLKKDKNINGGLKEISTQKRASSNGSTTEWSMILNYKFSSSRAKNIRTTLIKEADYWFIKSGGLLPPDLSIFDR